MVVRKVKRHWLLLVVAVALLVAALAAWTPVEAYHGGFYWQGGRNWDGEWVTCLYSGTTHRVLYCPS
jgi:hypothetical protein